MDKYISQGQVGSPANTTSNVRFDNSGDMALMRQQAGIGNTILAGAKMFVDQMQDTDITKASNMYNDKMSELRSQLMQNREENALDNMAKYEEGRQKILDEIYRTGPRFVRDGQGRQKFELAIEKDWIGQKNQMRGYMLGESEKYADNQTNNRLFGYNQNISEGYNNPMVLETNVDAGVEEVAKRYKYYGPERIEAAARQWKAQAYGNAITTALANNDYDTAGTLLQGNGKWLDPKTRASLDKLIVDRSRSDYMVASATGLFAKHGKNEVAAEDEYIASLGKGNTAAAAEKMLGQNLGNNTCAIFVSKMITESGGDTSMNSTLADGLFLNYEDKGKTFTDRSQLRDGDIVFWKVAGSGYEESEDKNAVNSGTQAYKGITHCGIVKGGKVIQSGTHGVSAMDIDANGYEFVGAAHTGRQLSATEEYQERQKFKKDYGVLLNRQKEQQNFIAEQTADQMLAMYQDGQPHSAKDYEDIALKVSGGNWDLYKQLKPVAAHFGKGGDYHKLSIEEMYMLDKRMKADDYTEEKLLEDLTAMNVKPSEFKTYFKQFQTLKKQEDKRDWSGIEKSFYQLVGGKDKVNDMETFYAKALAKRHAEYIKETTGKPASDTELISYMGNAVMKGETDIANNGGYGGYRPVDLASRNLYRVEDSGEVNGNGEKILAVWEFGSDKPRGITETNFNEFMKQALTQVKPVL